MSEPKYEIQVIDPLQVDGLTTYRIADTATDSRVATCYLRENAELVCNALNSANVLQIARRTLETRNAYVSDEVVLINLAELLGVTIPNRPFFFRIPVKGDREDVRPTERHERRVTGHVSGWQEQHDTCVCGQPWPCPKARTSK